MTNKHQKHFSTAANYGDSDGEVDATWARRDSFMSDAGLWSDHSVAGGSDRDELDDITSDIDDLPISSHTSPHMVEFPDSTTGLLFQPSKPVHSPPSSPSKTPLCDNILQWFDEQTQELGFEAMVGFHSISIKVVPDEGDWGHMTKLSTPAKISYLLGRFCPESSRASWFASREKLFFAKLAPQEMIRYLYLNHVDRETLLGTYFKTLGSPEGWLISEERKKALARFVFQGDLENLA